MVGTIDIPSVPNTDLKPIGATYVMVWSIIWVFCAQIQQGSNMLQPPQTSERNTWTG
jgi:hypothetical protein